MQIFEYPKSMLMDTFLGITEDHILNLNNYLERNKMNKGLRLEVHHAKTFDDICKENNITTVKGALACKEIWSLDNGISLCYGCHKNIERIRTELKNMFVI
ncbi:MAG: hypothetical protein WBZ20_07280 [Nitrososphaeraceae archaeon]